MFETAPTQTLILTVFTPAQCELTYTSTLRQPSLRPVLTASAPHYVWLMEHRSAEPIRRSPGVAGR